MCADVLIYIGDLTDVLRRAAAALAPRGVLAFTLEAPAAGGGRGDDDWRYVAQPSGRYAHRVEWVVETGARHGLAELRRVHLPKLRLDAGVPVPGTLLVLGRRRDDA